MRNSEGLFRAFFAPDENANGGGQPAGSGVPPSDPPPGEGQGGGAGDGGQTQNSGEGGGQSDPPSDPPPPGRTPEFTAEQQAHIDRLVGRAREDARRKAQKELDDESKRKQGEYKSLYEELKPKHETLEREVSSLRDKLKNHEGAINSVIDQQIKDWPESIKKLDPGPTRIVARQEWVKNSEDAVKEILAGKRAPRHDHGSGSNGEGSQKSASEYVNKTYARPGGEKK